MYVFSYTALWVCCCETDQLAPRSDASLSTHYANKSDKLVPRNVAVIWMHNTSLRH